jgi:hypothetical protein
MRLFNTFVPAFPKAGEKSIRFHIDKTVAVTTHKGSGMNMVYRPHVRLGQWSKDRFTAHCIPLGSRLLNMVAVPISCEREGEAIYGFCPRCHADISGDRIKTVEEKRDFFVTTREIGKHDRCYTVNPVSRGAFILSKDKDTLLLVEERIESKDDVGMILKVGGCKVSINVESSNPDYKKIADKVTGEFWSGPSLTAVDKVIAIKNGDQVTIERQLPTGREELIVIGVMSQYPQIISAKVLKDPAKVIPVKPETEAKEAPVDPNVELSIEKALSDLNVKQEDSAVEVESIRQMFRHVNDPRHISRVREGIGQEVGTDDLIRMLIDPIRVMASLKLMPEHEGRQFVFAFGKTREMKLVGDIVECGFLRLKTLYGRGNPVDKERESIIITPDKEPTPAQIEAKLGVRGKIEIEGIDDPSPEQIEEALKDGIEKFKK